MLRRVNAKALVESLVRWAGNVSVLALLLALVYFGHHYQWHLPKFSELGSRVGSPGELPSRQPLASTSAESSPHEVAAAGLEQDVVQPLQNSNNLAIVPTSQPKNRIFDLPRIAIGSPQDVERAGIEFCGVQLRQMDEFIAANGTVDYDHTRLARLSTRVGGIIWRVEKRVGDPVSKGEVLALIDSADVGRAKAEYLNALVQCNLKEQTFKRLSNLQDVVPGRRLLEAEADWRASRIHRINAEQSLITMGLPVDVDGDAQSFDQRLVSRIHHLGLPKTLVASIGDETQSANLLPLVSPLDGVVIRRDVVTGEVVPSSQTLFVVADVGQMWLHLNVRAEDVNSIAVGQEVLVSDDGVLRDHRGKVIWISTEVDPTTRTVKLRAELPNPRVTHDSAEEGREHRLFHANAYISTRIRVRQKPEALAVPSSAVRWFWEEKCHVVFLPVEGGTTLQPHRVQLGVKRDGFTEIVSGLNTGDRVAIAGTRLLQLELAGLSEQTVPNASPESTVASMAGE